MYVTVVCDNGEIKINTALLVILYTIFGNLVRGLNESTVILIKGIQEDDINSIEVSPIFQHNY